MHKPHPLPRSLRLQNCRFCGRPIYFRKSIETQHWMPVTPTGEPHTCQEYRDQPDRRNGPVQSRPATSEELEGLSQTK